MKNFIALLRAVNVGGTGKLKMAELRLIAQNIGFTNVRSYIQSGNLIFSAIDDPIDIKETLEKRLQENVGKHVGVIIRTPQQMQSVLDANPFSAAEPNKVGVIFLASSPTIYMIQTAKGKDNEQIALGSNEIFVHYPTGMGRSKLRLTAMSEGTVRNINTVTKLVKIATGA